MFSSTTTGDPNPICVIDNLSLLVCLWDACVHSSDAASVVPRGKSQIDILGPQARRLELPPGSRLRMRYVRWIVSFEMSFVFTIFSALTFGLVIVLTGITVKAA